MDTVPVRENRLVALNVPARVVPLDADEQVCPLVLLGGDHCGLQPSVPSPRAGAL